MDGLRQNGCQVSEFPFCAATIPRALRRLELHLGWGVYAFIKSIAIVRRVSRARPRIVWVDRGVMVPAWVLRRCRRQFAALTVHVNPDDPFGEHRKAWGLFKKAIREYDVHFVPRVESIAEYTRQGATKVYEFDRAYNPRLHRPVGLTNEDKTRFVCEVGFIGSYAPARAKALLGLRKAGIAVKVWGDGFEDFFARAGEKRCWAGPSLYGDEYVKAICGMNIALHFLRRENRDQQDSRTYEIPACGRFMLGERSRKHESLFVAGVEAEFFEDEEELLRKIRFYLKHSELRKRVAENGLERCVRGGYDYASRCREMLRCVYAEGA